MRALSILLVTLLVVATTASAQLATVEYYDDNNCATRGSPEGLVGALNTCNNPSNINDFNVGMCNAGANGVLLNKFSTTDGSCSTDASTDVATVGVCKPMGSGGIIVHCGAVKIEQPPKILRLAEGLATTTTTPSPPNNGGGNAAAGGSSSSLTAGEKTGLGVGIITIVILGALGVIVFLKFCKGGESSGDNNAPDSSNNEPAKDEEEMNKA